jgi:hypothetical protein
MHHEEQFHARYRRRNFYSSNSGWLQKKKSEPTVKKVKKMDFWLDVLLCVLKKVTIFGYVYMMHAGQGQTKSPCRKAAPESIVCTHTHTNEKLI